MGEERKERSLTAQDDLGTIIDVVGRKLCFLSVQMGNPSFLFTPRHTLSKEVTNGFDTLTTKGIYTNRALGCS